MKDDDNTREELVNELVEMRRRTAESEAWETRSKEAQEALQESEAKFLALIEQCPHSIIYTAALDKKSTTLYISPQIEEVLGYSQEEYKADPDIWANSIHPDDYNRVIDEVARCRETGEKFIAEYRMVNKDGRTVWFYDVADIVRDDNGSPLYLLGVNTDTTLRKQAEDLLRIQGDLGIALGSTTGLKETFDRVLEASLQIDGVDCGGVYVVDRQSGELDLVSYKGLPLRFVESISHHDADSHQARLIMAGKAVYGLHSELFPVMDKIREREDLRGLAVIPVQYEGQVIAVLNVASHTHDEIPDGARKTLEAIASQIGGVIARISAEKALEIKVTELNSLINNMPDMAWLKDVDSLFIAVNRAFGQAVGMDPESLINQTCEVCFGKEEAQRFREDDQRIIESRRQQVIEEKILDSQKNEIWLETIKSPIIDESGKVTGTVGIARDITKRKQAEEALKKAKDELEVRVEERTAELAKTNEQLRKEIEVRKRAEEELRDNEAMFRNLLEHIPGVSIQGYGTNGIVHYWNKASEDVYGYTAEEAMGQDLGNLIIPAELKLSYKQGLELGSKATESGELMPGGEYMLLRKDGSLVPVHSIHTVVCLEDKPPLMFCIDVDLSERKRAEEALKKAHDDLEIRVEKRTAELVKLNKKLKKEIGDRKQIEKKLRKREAELKIQTNELEELNSALKVLLKRRDEDKTALEESVVVNVKELTLPYLEKLQRTELEPQQMTLIKIIDSHLRDIVSPFTTKLSSRFLKLTPMEIKLANLIKEGKTTKEMAELLSLSENTIKVHRFQIRSKLGLKHKKINLRSYLSSLK